MQDDRQFDAGKDPSHGSGRPRASRSRTRRRQTTPQRLFLQLDKAVRIGCTPMLWGPPGVGKTERVRVWASLRKRKVFSVTLSQLDAIDVRGLPAPENGRTTYLRPNFLPGRTEKRCVLILDEFTNASITVHRAIYELVLERRIGDHHLPDDCVVICAGNRPEDRAGLVALPAPLTNRLLHLNVKADPSEWIAWARANDVDRRITDYIELFPGDLWSGSAAQAGPESAFATPRSWHGVSCLLRDDPDAPLDRDLRESIEGLVGPKVGGAFFAFARSGTSLADLEAVRHDPVRAPLPPSEEVFGYLHAYFTAILQRPLEQEGSAKGVAQLAEHDLTIAAIAQLIGRVGPDRGFQFGDLALRNSDRARRNPLLQTALRRLKGDCA